MMATRSQGKIAARNGAPPNIVFVFADDWGWGDLGCYGHESVQTPHLDHLASEGTLFTQFYVCSGVCSPSRAAVLTGQFPAQLGIHGHFAAPEDNAKRGMPDWLDPSHMTYTRLLQQAGYAVGHYGKWHLGSGDGAPEPAVYGIDDSRVNSGNGPQLEFSRDNWQPGLRARSSEFIVNHTIRFIEAHRRQPFLVNVWLNDTHAILEPNEEQLAPYNDLRPDFVGQQHCGANAIYYSVVSEADRQIGRLLKRLEELGLHENTVIIFSADNGPEDICVRNASHSGVGSSGPFRGRKRSLYEGGIRTPFILRWPRGGVRAGAVDNATPLCAVDLLPTFCALAGVEIPGEPPLDGESMADVFQGSERARTTPLLWEWRLNILGHVIHRSPMLAVRDGDWKLLLNPDGSRVELYDIPRDPTELTNLAEAHPEVVQRLGERAGAWQQALPDGPRESGAGRNDYPWPAATAPEHGPS